MVYRYAWIAGAAGILFCLVRLNELVRPTVDGAPWQLVVLAGALLGGVITWAALAYRLNGWLIVGMNAVALAIIIARVAVPDTTVALLPTMDTVRALRTELSYAFDVIQSGVAPVIPASGLVIIVTAVFWGLGVLLVWGLQTGRPYVGLVPPLLLYLQLATADRGFAGLAWVVVLVLLLAGTMAAVTYDERTAASGRLTRSRRVAGGVVSSSSMVTLVAAGLVAIFATSALATAVPPTGVLTWRQSSGLTGDYFGSVAFNPFINIQKSLVAQSNTPVFTAAVDGDIPADELYWRFLSLDTFNGIWWYADSPQMSRVEPDVPYEDPDLSFFGPTTTVTQDITIQRLRNDWIPSAYALTEFTAENEQVERGVRISEDASIRFGSRSFAGMDYRVVSEVPQPDVTLLAVDTDGQPTEAFAELFDDGTLERPETVPVPREVDLERFTQLPDDLDPLITEEALKITRGLDSDYERALALEAYFRNPEANFRYSVSIPAGEQAGDLAAWLFDVDNPNYRLGYCEQYANAMGAMARSLGMPTRLVLGFTPGELLPDGRVVVLDNNAHAWVEVWLGSQGWVRFDPTPRSDGINPSTIGEVIDELDYDLLPLLQPEELSVPDIETAPIPFPEPFLDEPPQRVLGAGEEDTETPFSLPSWVDNIVVLLLVVVLIVGTVPAVKWWRRRRRLKRLREGDVTAAWEEIVSRLSDLGDPPRPSETPLEVAERTDRAMRPLATVYAESIYGIGESTPGRTSTAVNSFEATEAAFSMRYSPARRAMAWYRVGSLRRRRRR